MATFLIDETPGLPSRAEAESWAQIFQLDGWQTEIVEEPGGTFLLRAKKALPPATNAGGAPPELDEGEPETPMQGGVKALLGFIAQHESNDNYNAFFRSADNRNNPKFTNMLLRSVVDWQRNFTQVNGSPSSAAGRYQIIRKTLESLIDKMHLDRDTVRFSSEAQDKMAIKLLEARGLGKFKSGALSLEDFGNNVAKEWASMPVLTPIRGHKGLLLQPGASFYSGDGLNAARASVDEFREALRSV